MKEEKGYPKEQHSLIIMDTFKDQRGISSVEERDWPSWHQNYPIWKLHIHLGSLIFSDNQEIIVNGFDSAGISEVVTKTSTILDKVENASREVWKWL